MFNHQSIEFTNFLQAKGREFISELSTLVKLQTIETLPEEFKSILRNIGDKITEAVNTISKDIEKITSKVQANTFNIGFFGETNAGKSTIIEALIGGDGSSIGTGIKDFTRDIVEYDLKLSNVDRIIKLIDMPGIEGKEQYFIEKIKEAVFRSHIVFYVTSASKEPERETLVKVRYYLNKKAKVLVLLNKRMGVESYEYKRVLIDDNTNKVVDRSRTLVQRELGNFFSGYIMVVDAHLAFLSRGKIVENNRFRKDKDKALSIFGSESEISSFSGLKDLLNKISELSNPQEMNLEIIRTNFYKILGEMERIIADILRNKKELDQRVKELIIENDKVINEIKTYWEKSKNQVLNVAYSEIDRVCNEIKARLFKAIENNEEVSKSEIERRINDSFSSIEKKIKTSITEISDYIQQRLKTHSEKIEILVSISKRQQDLSLKLEEILDKIKMKFEDYLERAFKSAITVILGLLAGTVGLIIAIIKAIWDFFFKTKKEQITDKKNRVSEEIKIMKEKLKKTLNRDLNRVLFQMNRTLKNIENNIKLLDKSVRLVISEIDSGIESLLRIRKDATIHFLREVFSSQNIDVKFGYIDLSLSGALLITNNSKQIDSSKVAEILNINKKNVFLFSDEFQILDYAKRANFSGNDGELIYRGLNSLKDEFNIHKITRDKITQKIEITFKEGRDYD